MPFPADVVAAVLAHMNGEHIDDSLLIARAFGSLDATDAMMADLDENGGTFEYMVDGEPATVKVPWSTAISERPEIRREVVALYERACEILGATPRDH